MSLTINDLMLRYYREKYAPGSNINDPIPGLSNGDDRNPGFLEFDYYKKNSGLPKGTFADHERKFLLDNFVATAGSAASVVRRNFIKNPNIAVDAAGFISRVNANYNRNTTYYHISPASIAVTVPADGVSSISTQQGKSSPATCTPGEVWTASVYIRYGITDQTRSFVAYMEFWDADGNLVSRSPGSTASLKGPSNWTRFSVTDQVPANAKYVSMFVDCSNALLNDEYQLDGWMLEKSPAVGSYFDGDTSNLTAWSGTANASTSVLLDPESLDNDRLQLERFIQDSGLTPPEKFSMADHEYHFYKKALGL